MKKYLFTILICLLLSGTVIYKLDSIVNTITPYFNNTPTVVLEEKNPYAKEMDFEYVQITDDFVPYNIQDLLNIFYTVLDSGYDKFTFYCPTEYADCIEDVKMISNPENSEILTTLGNYISPYNNFTYFNVYYDTLGEITLEITKLYSAEDINSISNKIDSIWKELVTTEMTTKEIIYEFHDYIINNTKYDELYEEELKQNKPSTYQSNKANGPLFQGYAICSGYTDTMAIILDKLGVKNFKVASKTHVWNVAYIEGEWLHLDLTWDDPVSENHDTNHLLHKFFLIDTETLESFNIENHTYNKAIYIELS